MCCDLRPPSGRGAQGDDISTFDFLAMMNSMIPSIGTLSKNLRTIDWSLLERNHCHFLACQGALAGMQGFTPSSLLPATTILATHYSVSQMVSGPLPK